MSLPTPYSVKRHGVTITNCDSEPIWTPGCIQPHGLLLVLRAHDLTVAQVSENSEAWLGLPPHAVLNQPVAAIVGEKNGERLRRFLDREPVEANPLYAFTSSIADARLDVSVHRLGEVVMVELERSGAREHARLDCYSLIKRSTARMQITSSVAEFCQCVADEMFALTGLDRVMVYRFLSDGSGEVFAEAKIPSLHSWRGLRYPADDIPKPARVMFQKIGMRPLPDARAEMMEMVPLVHPDTGEPLDMTYCALRGASVMYTEYLQNMGVAASLTMPLLHRDELWGLIACHHLTPTQFLYPVRTAAELLAQCASLHLIHAEERELADDRARITATHQAVLVRAAHTGDLARMLADKPTLRDGITCDAVALRSRDRWSTVGPTPTPAQLDELATWLATTPEWKSADHLVFATDELGRQFPPARAYPELASGVLATPLARTLNSLIVWFRAEQIQDVAWAGDPHDKPTTPGPHGPRLTPRVSFELWCEQARGRARPWTPVEVEAARDLRYLLTDVVMSRAERLATLNTELIRSNAELDAFAYVASHDLKEPLRAIHKYAHALLAEAKAKGQRHDDHERLDHILQLTVRMDGLLDALLHFARVGRLELELELLDLGDVLHEATDLLGNQLVETTVELRVPRPLPRIRCDRVRVREIFANLISNALRYRDRPDPWIEIGYIAPGETPEWFRPELVPPGVAGQTILYVRDNGLGIDPAHHQRVFALFKRLHADVYGGGTGAGLTITKKLVEQHHGQIWVDSTPGTGSTFFFTLGGDDEA